MKKILVTFLIIGTISCANNYDKQAAVTYDFSGGRFGDCLIAYLHAKWMSFTYGIPLLYKPFKYSDQLELDRREIRIDYVRLPARTKRLAQHDLSIDVTKPCLYTVPYFSEVLYERNLTHNKEKWIYFAVDWANKEFLQEIRNMINPIDKKLLDKKCKADAITVAVHVRKGGGFDQGELLSDTIEKASGVNYRDLHDPLRFPPEYYYVEQLKKLSELLNNCPLYVYIFTDDQNPAEIARRLQLQLGEYANIEFDYRKQSNSHDANVIEDFFAMTTFQCLIRPQSNFSLVAGLIGDFLIEIAPVEHHWEETKSVFDKIEIKDKRILS